MIPNQTELKYHKILPMLIIRHASNDDYRMSTFNILDDDIMKFLDPEINYGLIEEIIVDDWIHADPVLPNPEMDKIFADLFKLVDKIAKNDSYWVDVRTSNKEKEKNDL